jgi:hypothetical protein
LAGGYKVTLLKWSFYTGQGGLIETQREYQIVSIPNTVYEYFVPIPLYNAVMFCSWEDLAKIETNAAAYFFFKNGRYFFNCSPLPTEIDI